MAAGLRAIVGDTLQFKDDMDVDISTFSGKYVGLYFSAHWCPPCRGFTPKLVEWYKNFKENSPKKDEMEIIFISGDRDANSFDNYYGEMPWHALPFSDRETEQELGNKFGITGIPTLIILEADSGKLITDKGRNMVMSDPTGENFPWQS